jgi:hypothetical protein
LKASPQPGEVGRRLFEVAEDAAIQGNAHGSAEFSAARRCASMSP